MSKPDAAGGEAFHYRKKTNKWWRTGVLAISFILAGFILGQAVSVGSTTAPGSEGDPLVTVSWVKSTISQYLQEEQSHRQQLAERLQKLEEAVTKQPFPAENTSSTRGLEIVSAAAGEKLLTGTGTEIILRSGRAKVLAGAGGGLSDLTAGGDLTTGQQIKSNHLLLSARDDGRGAVLESQAIFLVHGGYRIE